MLGKAAVAMGRDDPPNKQFLNVDMHSGNGKKLLHCHVAIKDTDTTPQF